MPIPGAGVTDNSTGLPTARRSRGVARQAGYRSAADNSRLV